MLSKSFGLVFHRTTSAAAASGHQYTTGNIGNAFQHYPFLNQLVPSGRHHDLYEFSIHKPDVFWKTLGATQLEWTRPFDTVMDCNMTAARFKWFVGGRLNAAVNCVDRHCRDDPDRVALIWEKDEPGQEERITYRELQRRVNQMANVLLAHDVTRGDRVAVYMPISPMAIVAMLGCARIGAIHNVVFAGFSTEALAARVNDAQAEIVITCDQGVRGGKVIELKQVVDAAVRKCPGVRQVLVCRRTGNRGKMGRIDVDLDPLMDSASPECPPEVMESGDPLFMLYTSGSTGQPKGLIHSVAGYLLYAMVTHKLVFDYHVGDVFGCMADVGWITGHSYAVYGPLANGATTVLFESVPTYPDPGRYWEMVQRLGINQFYGAPTAIRQLMKHGDQWPQKYDLSSLRVLGSVGEPINHEAWHWYHHVVGGGRCTLVDTWWQTETGGVCIAPTPADPDSAVKPAMAMRPFLGIKPVLMSDEHVPATGPDSQGSLCLALPWPGMASSIYNDHGRFVRTYFRQFTGYYFTGDGAQTDEDGYFQITGRMDDVINVSGHRLGTAEIEDVLSEHPEVAEAAAIGIPHDIKGETVFAFVILRDNSPDSAATIAKGLKELIRKKIASYAVPEHILITPALPKTRSGKIMRRILKQVAVGSEKVGDVSTLADPGSLEELVKTYRAYFGK